MNNADAFSGLGWGDLGRYRIFNDTYIRKRRAADMDKRIQEIDAQERSIKWAMMLRDFWANDVNQSKDIMPLCKLGERLKEMRDEAKQIMQDEKDRIIAENRAAAARLDNLITAMDRAGRTAQWPNEVTRLESNVRQQSQDVRQYLTQTNLLAKLVNEANLRLSAQKADASIVALMRANRKDDRWLSEVQDLNRQLTAPIRAYITEKNLYDKLQAEFLRVQRYPVYSEYENLLREIEGKWKSDIKAISNKYDHLNRSLSQYGYSMDTYISDFKNRWAAAKGLIIAEKDRQDAAERARKQAEADRKNKATLQPYLSILTQIESGMVSSDATRTEFHRLDGTLRSLGFSPDQYSANFTTRWNNARAKVVAKEKEIEEEKRQAEERRRQIEAAKAAEQRRQRRKKEIAAGIWTIVIQLVGMALTALIIAFGFSFVAARSCHWYTLFVIVAAVNFYMQAVCNVRISVWGTSMSFNYDYDPYYNVFTIIEQILLYGMVILFSLMFGFGIFNIIVCCAVVALGVNVFNLSIDAPEDHPYFTHVLRAVGGVVGVIAGIWAIEFLLPSMVFRSMWHSLWLVPVILGVFTFVMGICVAAAGDAEDGCGLVALITSGVLGVLGMFRCIAIVYSFTGFGFLLFFFYAFLIYLILGGGAGGIGGAYALIEECY